MCIISTKNLTTAQTAKRVLAKEGIYSTVVNIDPALTKKGCSYGLSYNCAEYVKVRKLLNAQGIAYGDFAGQQNLS